MARKAKVKAVIKSAFRIPYIERDSMGNPKCTGRQYRSKNLRLARIPTLLGWNKQEASNWPESLFPDRKFIYGSNWLLLPKWRILCAEKMMFQQTGKPSDIFFEADTHINFFWNEPIGIIFFSFRKGGLLFRLLVVEGFVVLEVVSIQRMHTIGSMAIEKILFT